MYVYVRIQTETKNQQMMMMMMTVIEQYIMEQKTKKNTRAFAKIQDVRKKLKYQHKKKRKKTKQNIEQAHCEMYCTYE